MTQQIINLGAAGSGAGGDTARTAFEKIIANFAELYAAALPGTAAQKQAARDVFGLVMAGLGGGSVVYSGDLNTLTTGGFWYATGANRPFEANGYVLVEAYTANFVRQTFTRATGTGFKYVRNCINGVWGAWFLDYDQSSVIGAVSQSSGVPTGAIIERGSNANGEYTRYADGTQECWSPIITSVGVAVTTAAAGGFRGTQNEWPFPAAFSSPPTCVHSTRASTHQQGELRALSTTSMQPSAWCATSSPSVSCAYQAYAVGRWY